MKIRSVNEFQDAIDKSIGWRRQELLNFKAAISSSRKVNKDTLIRSCWLLAYAHLEGFVKEAGEFYVSYLCCKGIKLSKLKCNFIAGHHGKLIETISETKRGIVLRKSVESIIDGLEVNFNADPASMVKTKSNLTFERFCDIAALLDISVERYNQYSSFINNLVEQRNTIAHGKKLLIDESECDDACVKVLEIISLYKQELEDCVINSLYLKASISSESRRPNQLTRHA